MSFFSPQSSDPIEKMRDFKFASLILIEFLGIYQPTKQKSDSHMPNEL